MNEYRILTNMSLQKDSVRVIVLKWSLVSSPLFLFRLLPRGTSQHAYGHESGEGEAQSVRREGVQVTLSQGGRVPLQDICF